MQRNQRPPFLQSGGGMALFYISIPIISNALVLTILNVVIGPLIYDRGSFSLFKTQILDNPLHNFLVNILPFPVVMVILVAYSMPAFRALRYSGDVEKYEKGLRRMLNAPFIIGLASFIAWLTGTFEVRMIYFLSGIPQSWILIFRVMGIAAVSGIFNFVLNYYLLSLVNRRFFIPSYLGGRNISEVKGAFRLSLRFQLEIFLLAVATGPILILGLSLMNLQSLVPEAERPSYVRVTGLMFGLIAAGVLLSVLLARSLRRPLSRMRNAARTIQQGDFSVRLPVDTTDEIGDLAQSINDMTLGLAEKEKIKDSFGRAVDPRVRDFLLQGSEAMGGSETEATILFSDIRGFTSFSESHTAQEVVEWINTYFERMAECVRAHGGVVNKYVGDAILAIFNAPVPLENHQRAALDCALQMLNELSRLNAELAARGNAPIRIGIGLHTGPVVAGLIGSNDRREYTVIGDTVNTASRIEGLCKKFSVPLLASESIYRATDGYGGLVRLGRAQVKGKAQELVIYGLPRTAAEKA
ncbi:MAG: HAMP domain-containing protein [Leptospiraceae bacterium]|nr:HAMP domain-containing protein [Leptospiraceae bacterium]